jgi:hypothetical protein
MEDQAVNVVRQAGKRDVSVSATQAHRADEQPHLILFPGEDTFDAGANGGPGGVGAGGVCRHRLAPRLLAMDAAHPPHALRGNHIIGGASVASKDSQPPAASPLSKALPDGTMGQLGRYSIAQFEENNTAVCICSYRNDSIGKLQRRSDGCS